MLHGPPSVLAEGVHKKIDNDLEYWRVDDVLNIFKSVVDPDLIGNAKQVKQYRDWIAHRNPKKAPPKNVPPNVAYAVLLEIEKQLSARD